jgi:hypothetical protein
MADPVLAWSPILPPGMVLTVPPQGASAPGPYAAESLGRAVVGALGLPFVEVLGDRQQILHPRRSAARAGKLVSRVALHQPVA